MRIGRMLMWLCVLQMVLALQPVVPHFATAQTHTVSDERWAVCPVEARPLFELDDFYVKAQEDPVPMDGAFPSPSLSPQQPGATYEYLNGNRLPADRSSSTIILDGHPVVIGGIFSSHLLEDVGTIDFAELTSVIDFLSLWSTCSNEPIPQQLAGLATDFGLKWIFSKGDPFIVQSTPLSVVRSNNISHAKGALPLLVVEARKLSDGRVMLVIGEGSGIAKNGNLLLPEIPGAIWILDMTEDGWRVDAVFGGVRLRHTEWIEVN